VTKGPSKAYLEEQQEKLEGDKLADANDMHAQPSAQT
jgi:hypothetical protein